MFIYNQILVNERFTKINNQIVEIQFKVDGNDKEVGKWSEVVRF